MASEPPIPQGITKYGPSQKGVSLAFGFALAASLLGFGVIAAGLYYGVHLARKS